MQSLAVQRAPHGAADPVRLPRLAFIDSLRAFVTLLVVAHHAVLAYFPYAPPPSGTLATQPILWPAFPVVDAARWTGIDLFVGFNDTFFMSLMFLISGLFVVPSLKRKGAAVYLKDRARRLGIPFVIGAILMPIAYYPAFLQRDQIGGFIAQWKSLPYWPAGPLWFLWVLLAFDALSAVLILRWEGLLSRAAGLFERRGFLVLVAGSAAVYLPLAALAGPGDWFSFGPFSVQSSRILHYALYFFAGAALGARELVPPRRWFLWLLGAAGCFLVSVSLFVAWITQHASSQGWAAAVSFGFCLSCAASSLAAIAMFARFGRGGSGLLGKNAYGIYLTHYFFVSWLQYFLLPVGWPAWVKALVVFSAASALAFAASQSHRLRGGARESARRDLRWPKTES